MPRKQPKGIAGKTHRGKNKTVKYSSHLEERPVSAIDVPDYSDREEASEEEVRPDQGAGIHIIELFQYLTSLIEIPVAMWVSYFIVVVNAS